VKKGLMMMGFGIMYLEAEYSGEAKMNSIFSCINITLNQ
jgi:hypothetical protein